MAKRLAELGALQDAVSNDESSPKRLALAGYIRGLFLDWSANPYNPLSRLTARGRLLGYFWDSGAIGLSMNFADQNYLVKDGTVQSKSFSQIVNFSRTTNATVTNSAGQITYAPHNLLTFSEQFDNAVWNKIRATVSANTINAPDGTTTADSLIEDTTAANTHILSRILGTPLGAGTYTYSAYFKENGRRYVQLLLNVDPATTNIRYSAMFDLTLGEISSTASSNSPTQTSSSIQSVGNGWYRCAVTIGNPNGLRTDVVAYLSNTATANNSGINYTGDGISGVYTWGAQLEIGSTATTYNPTTVKNLLGYSELFDNAAWTKSNSFVQTNLLTFSEAFDNAAWTKTTITATANSFTAPNTYQTADTLTATGANSTALQTFTASAVPYTFSVYLYRKTGTGNIDITVDGTTWVTKTITAGWTRVDTTLTPAAGSKTAGIRIATNGDEVYSWGAQLVQGSVAGDYRRTDAAALPVYYPNHNGVVCAEQLHGTASNGTILESYTASGAPMTFSVWMRRITGTGNIDITMDTGVTWTTQAITTSWARYSITSTPASGARTAGIRLVTSGDVIQVFGGQVSPSASLDDYVLNATAAPTAAAYYGARFDYDPVTLAPKGLLIEEQRQNLLLNSTISGTNLATQNVTVTAVAHTLSFYGTGSITLSGTATATLTGTGAYPTRSTLTFTPTAGTLTLTVSGTVQYAQLEIGSFATSFIPTAASQVTRAADVATIQGSNFYSFYNQNEGSVYAQAQSVMSTGALTYTQFNDGTANNIIRQFASTSVTGIQVQYNSSSVASISIGVGSNNLNKIAGAYKVNDFAAAQNNVLGTADTSGDVPIVTRFSIGASSTGTLLLNGTIKQISYYPQRLSNDVLKGLTA